MKFRPSPLFLAIPILAGCRNPAPGYVPVAPPKAEPLRGTVATPTEIMPLDVGNQWTYALQTESTRGGKKLSGSEGTVTYRVTQRDGDRALLLLEQDGKLLEQQDWESSGRGLFMASGTRGRVAYSPPQPIAELPLDAGRSFVWRGHGPLPSGGVGEGSLKGVVRSPENVDTAMGSLQAYPVAIHTDFAKGSSDNVSWFRPGVGLVRVRQVTVDKATGRRDLLLLSLNTYNVKGAKPSP